MKKYLTHLLYLILKKDMIRKLKENHKGTQFIDDVMGIFNVPTNLTDKYINTLSKEVIIKKWQESGLLDNLTEMNDDHPMVKLMEMQKSTEIIPFDKIGDVVECGNKLYYNLNPNSKMDVPSYFYERLEPEWDKWVESKECFNISFYDYCKSKVNLIHK
jgi:hypothetical protein